MNFGSGLLGVCLFAVGLLLAEHLPFGDGHPRQQAAGALVAIALFFLGWAMGAGPSRRTSRGTCPVCSIYRWARASGRVAPDERTPHHAPCPELAP